MSSHMEGARGLSSVSLLRTVNPSWGFPEGSVVKNPPANERREFDPWVGKVPWRRKWQPTPLFLPGKSLGQRSLVGDSPWGCKELDTTERLNNKSLHEGSIPLMTSPPPKGPPPNSNTLGIRASTYESGGEVDTKIQIKAD